MKWLPRVLAGASLVLAATSGFLASTVLAQGNADPPRTVTVDVGTGARGPQGPPGPAGPTGPAGQGGGVCSGAPTSYSPGFLKINTPGGQVTIWTCLGP
jgi:hypothetical protein